MDLNKLRYDENGLIPVIIQDHENGQVLMLAFADQEALKKTLNTNRTHFWSRSRKKLWEKGEESGNYQEVKEIYLDCDYDTVLILVKQHGVTCHTGNRTCFFKNIEEKEMSSPTFRSNGTGKTLEDVYQVIEDRKRNPREGSYVSELFLKGIDKILKKVGEEASETIIAAKNNRRDEIIYEMADLWFHSLIMLGYFSIPPEEIYQELGKRFGKSGIRTSESEASHG